MNIDMFKLDSIMHDDNNARTGLLMPVLQDNSVEFYYMPEESLEYVIWGLAAQGMRVFSVDSFFNASILKKKSSKIVQEELESKLEIKDDNTHTGLVILTN